MISNSANTRQHGASDGTSKDCILQRSEIGFISLSSSCPQEKNLPKKETIAPAYAPPVSTSFTNEDGTMGVSLRTGDEDRKQHLHDYMHLRPPLPVAKARRVSFSDTVNAHSFIDNYSHSDCSQSDDNNSQITGPVPIKDHHDTDSSSDEHDTEESDWREETKLTQQKQRQRPWKLSRDFYSLFLLGVGSLALLLVMVGFFIPTHTEDVYHNSGSGKDMVVRNQDTKMTFYVLAMALMAVLLGGSACYFYSNWNEWQEKLRRHRKVELSVVDRWGSAAVVVLDDKENPVLPK